MSRRLLLALAATSAGSFEINLNTPSFVTDEKFVSYSFDASQYRGLNPFGFFNSARVDSLLTGLGPAFFRFSGTDIDYTLFNETAECNSTVSSDIAATRSPMCLNSTQIVQLLNITTRTNMSLIFGVNGYVGKSAEAPNAPWDPTNAAAMFAWMQGALQANPSLASPAAFELGNEEDLWPQRAQGSVLASDLAIFRSLVAQYPALANTSHFGPDNCQCYNGDLTLTNYSKALPPSLIESSDLHFTWHFYNDPPGHDIPYSMVNATSGDILIHEIALVQDQMRRSGNAAAIAAPLVIGETGECAGGGCTSKNSTTGQDIEWSETFIDSYLKLDKLGVSAAMNISVVIGEKLFGGNDGFISAMLFPLGSYWVQMLHKGLVGNRVLQVTNSTSTGRTVRVYAHCARSMPGPRPVPTYQAGAVVVIAINFDWNNSATINLTDADTGAEVPLTPRDEYILTSGGMPPGLPGADPACAFGSQPRPLPYLPPAVCVNGQLMFLADGPAGFNTTLPAVQPVTVTDPTAQLVLPPLGIGFFVLPQAGAAACMPA